LATEVNRVSFFGRPELAALGYGMPADRVAVVRW
jgi:hypothetical protein